MDPDSVKKYLDQQQKDIIECKRVNAEIIEYRNKKTGLINKICEKLGISVDDFKLLK